MGSVNYSFTDDSIRVLTPNGTSEGGGTLVEVGGHGLLGGGLYLCSFGRRAPCRRTSTPPTDESSAGRRRGPRRRRPRRLLGRWDRLRPLRGRRRGGGRGQLQPAAVDGGRALDERRRLHGVRPRTLHTTRPRLTDLEPTVGPSAGDTDVVIHGDFGDAPAWACRVGDARPAAAELVDADARRRRARAAVPAAHRARGERVGRPAGDACQLSFEAHEVVVYPNPRATQAKYETYGDAAANGGRWADDQWRPDDGRRHGRRRRHSPRLAWRAQFDLEVDGYCGAASFDPGDLNCGGEGVSFSLGPLPISPPEWGRR